MEIVTLYAWALIVLFAFHTCGQIIERILRIPPIGFGLRALLGMAGFLALGGCLLLSHIANRLVLESVVWVLVGTGLFLNWPARRPQIDGRTILPLVPAFIIACVKFFLSVHGPGSTNLNDDELSYYAFVRQILDAGTLLDPFSLRRVFGFGGQQFLDALIALHVPFTFLGLLDSGIGTAILFLLVAESLAPMLRTRPWVVGLISSALMLYTLPRINTNASLTGTLLCLGVLLLIARGKPSITALALLVAGAATLRPVFGIFAGILACGGLILSGEHPWKRAGLTACLTAVATAPWSVLLWLSSSTIAYPPFHGNLNPEFVNLAPGIGAATKLMAAIVAQLSPPILGALSMGLLVRSSSNNRLAGLAFVSALGLSVLSEFMLVGNLRPDNERYILPVLFAAFVFLILTAAPTPLANLRIFICLGLFGVASSPCNLIQAKGALDTAILALRGGFEALPTAVTAYQGAQNSIPAGATILAVTPRPYLLDYRRNRIWNIDAIGGASPAPGIPLFKGDRAMQAYLIGVGVRYLLVADFRAINPVYQYSPAYWESEKMKELPQPFWQSTWAPAQVAFIKNVEGLRARLGTTIQSEYFYVIDLGSPSS